jgi:hypothetical protein
MRGNMTAIVWKDKQNVNTLPHMHYPSAEVNFSEYGNAGKPATVKQTSGLCGQI